MFSESGRLDSLSVKKKIKMEGLIISMAVKLHDLHIYQQTQMSEALKCVVFTNKCFLFT